MLYSSTKGYSLIELLAVIAIVLILAAGAILGIGLSRCALNDTALNREIQLINSAYQNYIATGGPTSDSKNVIMAALDSQYNGVGPFLIEGDSSGTYLRPYVDWDNQGKKFVKSPSWSCWGSSAPIPTPTPTPTPTPIPTPSPTPAGNGVLTLNGPANISGSDVGTMTVSLVPDTFVANETITVTAPYNFTILPQGVQDATSFIAAKTLPVLGYVGTFEEMAQIVLNENWFYGFVDDNGVLTAAGLAAAWGVANWEDGIAANFPGSSTFTWTGEVPETGVSLDFTFKGLYEDTQPFVAVGTTTGTNAERQVGYYTTSDVIISSGFNPAYISSGGGSTLLVTLVSPTGADQAVELDITYPAALTVTSQASGGDYGVQGAIYWEGIVGASPVTISTGFTTNIPDVYEAVSGVYTVASNVMRNSSSTLEVSVNQGIVINSIIPEVPINAISGAESTISNYGDDVNATVTISAPSTTLLGGDVDDSDDVPGLTNSSATTATWTGIIKNGPNQFVYSLSSNTAGVYPVTVSVAANISTSDVQNLSVTDILVTSVLTSDPAKVGLQSNLSIAAPGTGAFSSSGSSVDVYGNGGTEWVIPVQLTVTIPSGVSFGADADGSFVYGDGSPGFSQDAQNDLSAFTISGQTATFTGYAQNGWLYSPNKGFRESLRIPIVPSQTGDANVSATSRFSTNGTISNTQTSLTVSPIITDILIPISTSDLFISPYPIVGPPPGTLVLTTTDAFGATQPLDPLSGTINGSYIMDTSISVQVSGGIVLGGLKTFDNLEFGGWYNESFVAAPYNYTSGTFIVGNSSATTYGENVVSSLGTPESRFSYDAFYAGPLSGGAETVYLVVRANSVENITVTVTPKYTAGPAADSYGLMGPAINYTIPPSTVYNSPWAGSTTAVYHTEPRRIEYGPTITRSYAMSEVTNIDRTDPLADLIVDSGDADALGAVPAITFSMPLDFVGLGQEMSPVNPPERAFVNLLQSDAWYSANLNRTSGQVMAAPASPTWFQIRFVSEYNNDLTGSFTMEIPNSIAINPSNLPSGWSESAGTLNWSGIISKFGATYTIYMNPSPITSTTLTGTLTLNNGWADSDTLNLNLSPQSQLSVFMPPIVGVNMPATMSFALLMPGLTEKSISFTLPSGLEFDPPMTSSTSYSQTLYANGAFPSANVIGDSGTYTIRVNGLAVGNAGSSAVFRDVMLTVLPVYTPTPTPTPLPSPTP